jgi:hypothetical protein
MSPFAQECFLHKNGFAVIFAHLVEIKHTLKYTMIDVDRILRKLASDSLLVHPKREKMMIGYTHHTFKVS